ncbi:hypothetical protein QR680_017416 [Steinernema hermaphroditum]|uniref:MULE transposase domain-containing protein n=1 Tax=Steinernema hermaphroditum TaxID=289476 RepID=A0AA39HGV1_9BILA|nr:hypothetical protein QR680_017416 [Steinernema hermaphroditum]
MWNTLRESLNAVPGNLQIQYAHFDCESAAVQTFREFFPEVRAKMCLFHIKQCINRKLQALGLSTTYRESGKLEKIVRQLGALSLLPQYYVTPAFRLLRRNLPTDDLENDWMPGVCQKIIELFDYYSNEWIDNPLGLDFVNLYDMTEGPRTTNHAEAYHSAQRHYWRSPHMPLGEWLATFQNVHHAEETRIRDVLLLRIEPRPRHPTAIVNDEKLQEARRRLEDVLESGTSVEEFWEFVEKYLTRVGAVIGYNVQRDQDTSEELLTTQS